MVHVPEVTQFVGHHIIEQRQWHMHQMPIQADGAVRARTAPTLFGMTIRECGGFDP